MGDDCGTGVAFTRDPATGEKKLMGEFLTNAQGEDVVAGVRTPMHISEMEEKFPEAFKQFNEVCHTLETHYRDMQDMEFTVEHGKLYKMCIRDRRRPDNNRYRPSLRTDPGAARLTDSQP